MYQRVETGDLAIYVEGGQIRREMRGGYIDDDIYPAVLDQTIVVCTDAIVVNSRRRTVYLAKRAVKPMQDIWVIGGRRYKCELPAEGMKRNFERETGLGILQNRFHFLEMTEYIWQDRAQAPEHHGSHNLCHQFFVELGAGELETARRGLEKKEYAENYGLQEFSRSRLVDERVHPVILDIYDRLFPSRAVMVFMAARLLSHAILPK